MRVYRGFFLWAAVIACGSIGCGPDIEGLCQEAEDCRRGNEADVEACILSAEYDQEVADIRGCTDEYELYFECFAAEATCDTMQNSFELNNNLCEAERNAYQNCT